MKPILLALLLITFFYAPCQTLYTPGGTIGNNTTNTNVGIGMGITAPEYKLDILSTENYKQLRIKAPGAPLMKFSGSYNSGDGAEIFQESSGNFLINTNSQKNAISVTPDGKVGIGLYDPGYSLVVSGEVHVNNNYPYIQFNSSYWGSGSFIQNAVSKEGMGGGEYMLLYNPASKGFNFRQGDYNALTIQPNGTIGIGTSEPGAKLEINHVGAQLKLTGSPVAGGVWTSATNVLYLADWNTGNNGLNVNMTTGKVGIGTTNPDERLTVKGVIHTNEVRVDMDPPIQGPDYVFEKDYDLLSLTELEAYINQNKHLPEVPSAKEMAANGLNLKEMNLLLLKKVEELTLHLIEQSHEIKKVNEENKELRERMSKLESKRK